MVMGVYQSEEEVVASSFRFRFKKSAAEPEREIEIQFMEDPNTKEWVPNPAPPKELP